MTAKMILELEDVLDRKESQELTRTLLCRLLAKYRAANFFIKYHISLNRTYPQIILQYPDSRKERWLYKEKGLELIPFGLPIVYKVPTTVRKCGQIHSCRNGCSQCWEITKIEKGYTEVR
jgi:hypothetical protein